MTPQTDIIRCDFDSGSITGCRPLCDRAARHTITYQSYGPHVHTSNVCAHDLDARLARIYPYSHLVKATAQPWERAA